MTDIKQLRELIDTTCKAKGTTGDRVLLRLLFIQSVQHCLRTVSLQSTADPATKAPPADAGLNGTVEFARMLLVVENLRRGTHAASADSATDENVRLKHLEGVTTAERSIATLEAMIEILRTIINSAENMGVKASIKLDELLRDGLD